MQIILTQVWALGQQIGEGGFGKVYEAKSEAYGKDAVVKLVPKAPGAQRELLFSDLKDVRNIIPILDRGETEDCWVLVMPRAEKSLRERLRTAGGPLDQGEVLQVLMDTAEALEDLEDRVVHRDLSPGNILLFNRHWCLTDFGISRYAEATTAEDTRKFAMSPPYAAPERWRHVRATTATDVYALGVIAYELLAGSLPFKGPTLDDFRDQHLHQDPDPLNGASTLLTGLIDECLNKAPAARPRPTNVLARLSRVAAAPSSSGMVKLQQASRAEGARRSDASRQASIQQSEAERRQDLKRAAERSMQQIATAVSKTIDQAAPMANLSTGPSTGWTASLNQAELRLAPHSSTRAEPWGVSPAPAFEVVSHSTMSIQIPQNRYGYNGRSHALWFCDAQEAGRFQWFETAFMISPLVRQLNPQDPFALDPGEEASRALGPGPAYVQVAWPLTALTVGDLEEFISRWLGWFGDAAQGQLSRPTAMPERDPQGSWRRS